MCGRNNVYFVDESRPISDAEDRVSSETAVHDTDSSLIWSVNASEVVVEKTVRVHRQDDALPAVREIGISIDVARSLCPIPLAAFAAPFHPHGGLHSS